MRQGQLVSHCFFSDYILKLPQEIALNEYEIALVWDNEAHVWIAENDDIPVALESDSLDTLIERVKLAVPELLVLNGKNNVNVALNFKMERQTVMV